MHTNMSATPDTLMTSPIGRSTPRVDGPLKVSGKAQYTSDFHFPGTLYAVPAEATIVNGRVVTLDTAAAEQMPGVRAILHRENIGTMFRSVPEPGFAGICEERRLPFEDDVVRYYGQYIALAVADTFETAKAAADAVRVTYAKEKPNVATDLEADDDPEAAARAAWCDPRRQTRVAPARLCLPPAHARRPPRRLWRSDAVPIQRAQPPRDVWPGQAPHWCRGRYARPRPCARPLCHRIGDE
jgi:xanthine dehydrogenase molybdopterin-binding subunit B